jgi:hypothetical protein
MKGLLVTYTSNQIECVEKHSSLISRKSSDKANVSPKSVSEHDTSFLGRLPLLFARVSEILAALYSRTTLTILYTTINGIR